MERLRIKVSAGFWLMLFVATLLGQGYVAMYFLAVLLHELAHYCVARRLFYRCYRVELGVFGAVLYGEFDCVSRRDNAVIAVAGPACNLVLCFCCFGLWWICPSAYPVTEGFFTANLSMAAVNLLPFYPLDGGRLAVALLGGIATDALRLVKKATVIASLGLFGIFIFSLLTDTKLFNVGLFAVCLFAGVLSDGGGECYARLSVADGFWKRSKHGMEKRTLIFTSDCTLADVIKRMRGGYLYCLEIVNDNLDVIKKLSVAELERVALTLPSTTPLTQIVAG